MSSLPPLLQHYDYVTLDQTCDCQVCRDWREKHRQYEAAKTGHPRSCMCDGCQHMRELGRAYHAARTRREVFSEMSFHAGWGDLPHAEEAMSWVYQHIMSPGISDGWWSKRAPYYPMEHWFRQAEKGIKTAALAVSGALSVMVTGAVSLIAAVSGSVRLTYDSPVASMPPSTEVSEDLMTTSSALKAMRDEAEQLEGELQKLPLYRRFRALSGFIEYYTRDHLEAAKVQVEKAVPKVKAAVKKAAAAAAADTDALIVAVKAHLRALGKPALGRDIAEALKAKGVNVPGNHPGRTLGIILSRHADFAYDKATGFSVKGSAS